MEKIQVELNIIHPTEGTISNTYNLDSLGDLGALEGSVKPMGLFGGGGLGNIIEITKGIKCAAGCQHKKGFVACVARCMVDGICCDGGTDC